MNRLYILGISSSCDSKLQSFCSIKYFFRQIFLPFQQFTTSNSCDILTFKLSPHLIPVTFSLKVANVLTTFFSFIVCDFVLNLWKLFVKTKSRPQLIFSRYFFQAQKIEKKQSKKVSYIFPKKCFSYFFGNEIF